MFLDRLYQASLARRPTMSDAALGLRRSARLLVLLAGLALAGAFAGARGWIPREFGLAFALIFFACLLLALLAGARARRQALADRELQSGRAMIVLLAAQLGQQDDATLERIAGKGGPAGEAAQMILTGRRGKAAADR